MITFDDAVAIILREEGGYVNNPDDPGGETKYGISKRSHPLEDIKNLTKERAAEIYRDDYWTEMKCDELPGPMALFTFDAAVNQGKIGAAMMLQEAVGIERPDGIIGFVTLEAARHRSGPIALVRFCRLRLQRYIGLAQTRPRQLKFLVGWIERTLRVFGDAIKLEDRISLRAQFKTPNFPKE